MKRERSGRITDSSARAKPSCSIAANGRQTLVPAGGCCGRGRGRGSGASSSGSARRPAKRLHLSRRKSTLAHSVGLSSQSRSRNQPNQMDLIKSASRAHSWNWNAGDKSHEVSGQKMSLAQPSISCHFALSSLVTLKAHREY